MKSILMVVLIISIIVIFFFLNYVLKKNIENYGVYCGMYNTSSMPELSCINDTECTWNSNLGYCTNEPSTYVGTPSIFASLESDLTDISRLSPREIEQEILDLENVVVNDTNIISNNVNSAVTNIVSKVNSFDSTLFSNDTTS